MLGLEIHTFEFNYYIAFDARMVKKEIDKEFITPLPQVGTGGPQKQSLRQVPKEIG